MKKTIMEEYNMSNEKYLVIIIGFIIIISAIYHYISKKPLTIYHNTRPLLAKNISDITAHNLSLIHI